MRNLKVVLAFIIVLASWGGMFVPVTRAGEMAPQAHAPVPAALTALKAQNPAPRSPEESCGYHAPTAELLGGTTGNDWLEWVRRLSGELPVVVGGETYTITTRYTPALFSGAENARAYDYVLEQVQAWHYPAQYIEQDPWSSPSFSGTNLVVTIPGQITPTQVVALTAHLDSLSPFATRETLAPGAEDNASGSAALLEAARLFRYYQFDRTVKIIWFTGEEQGLLGSYAYAADHSLSGYQGVVNLDMFGYDSDNDRCFELHVGTLPASSAVGQCIQDGITAYSLNLSSDFITSGATGSSDHAPFWNRGVGAVEVLENNFTNLGGGCNGVRDRNPYYHTINDTVANSFPPYDQGQPNTVGADIARAGLAAVADLAGNRGACFSAAPVVSARTGDGTVRLSWEALPGVPPEAYAAAYRVYRAGPGGSGGIVHFTTGTEWTDSQVVVGAMYTYRVEGLAADGVCVSQMSAPLAMTPVAAGLVYLPVVRR